MILTKGNNGDRQAALLRVARMLSSARDIEELLDYILETSRDVMASEICSVLLPVNEAGDLRILSTFEHPDIHEFIVPAGKGIAGEVFQTRQPIMIRDAAGDPRFYEKASAVSGLNPRAMLTIPLLDGDRCLGVLQVINPVLGGIYEQDDEELFEAFGSLCAVTLLRLEVQKQLLKEVQREEQMGLAREIQHSFLPAKNCEIEGFELRAFYEPASAIGGDFYFWHQLGGGKVLFGVGDVTGKGLPAALDMARGSTLVASLAHRAAEIPLGDWVCEVNKGLCDVMTAGRFIGVSAMLLDRGKEQIQICAAGLPAPLMCRDGRWVETGAPGNPPLGIVCSMSFAQIDLPLSAAKHWLIFTDGILEEANAGGEFFEDVEFARSLERAADLQTAGEVIECLSGDWQAFCGSRPGYRDDATVIVATRHAGSPPEVFDFTCCPETINRGRRFIESWAQYAGFDDHDCGLIVLGCDEVMSNIVKHVFRPQGRAGTGVGPVRCRVAVRDGGLKIRIEHKGTGISDEDFARHKKESPSPGERPGGLGLRVIDEVFDAVNCFAGNPERGEPASIELNKALRDKVLKG